MASPFGGLKSKPWRGRCSAGPSGYRESSSTARRSTGTGTGCMSSSVPVPRKTHALCEYRTQRAWRGPSHSITAGSPSPRLLTQQNRARRALRGVTRVAKIEITKTELVWPSKYNEDGARKEVPRVRLPFQVIETVNESRATREEKKTKGGTLFDIYEGREGDTFEQGWRNKLIWGDNLLVMGSLLEKFAGRIDLIYIDPPFATGADFSFRASVGEEEVTKEASLLEEKAYRDTWGCGLESFVQMLFDRFQLMRDLLTDHGSIYVHIGWDVSHYIKAALDEV